MRGYGRKIRFCWVYFVSKTRLPETGERYLGHRDLKDPDGLKKLWQTVERYYQVVTRAIKQYDPHHLILGHRFNQSPDTPNWCLEIAADYTDAILANWWIPDLTSVGNVLDHWHNLTGKPILISDIAFLCPTTLRPAGQGEIFSTANAHEEKHTSVWLRHCVRLLIF